MKSNRDRDYTRNGQKISASLSKSKDFNDRYERNEQNILLYRFMYFSFILIFFYFFDYIKLKPTERRNNPFFFFFYYY